MINTLLGKIIGTQNERELKRLRPLVGQINQLGKRHQLVEAGRRQLQHVAREGVGAAGHLRHQPLGGGAELVAEALPRRGRVHLPQREARQPGRRRRPVADWRLPQLAERAGRIHAETISRDLQAGLGIRDALYANDCLHSARSMSV